MKNLVSVFFLSLLLSLNANAEAQDIQLAKIKKNRFYYCNQDSRSLSIKVLEENGNLITQTALSKRKIRNTKNKLLLTNQKLKSLSLTTKNKNKKNRLLERIRNNTLLRKKFNSCLKGVTQQLPNQQIISDQLPEDLELPPVFSATNIIAGQFSGTCSLAGNSTKAYQDNIDERIQTPVSGQITCKLDAPIPSNLNILLRVTRKSIPQNTLFSSIILREQINSNNTFTTVICKEFPGCFYSNLIAKNIAEGGINITLEPYSNN